MTPEIEEFAKAIVQHVRDAAIRSSDQELSPTAAGPVANRWRKAAKSADPNVFARELIPDIVDDTIFYVLYAIDNGIIELTFRASNGRAVDLTKEGLGELGGWFAGSDGWRETYSKERYIDDFADLKLPPDLNA